VQRNPASALTLADFDEAFFQPALDAAHKNGYEIVSLSERALAVPEMWIREYWTLENSLLRDVPQPTPFVDTVYATVEQRLTSAHFSSEGVFLALHGEDTVGMTEIYRNRTDPTLGSVRLTGVVEAHRRKGVATALKTKAILWAREVGIKRIATDNEEANPMGELNRRLGFVVEYDMVILARHT
jgi:GNAT superfamily N-acetyltransferase